MNELLESIFNPAEGFARQQALRNLLTAVDDADFAAISPSLFNRINSIMTDDGLESVLIGLVLFRRSKSGSDMGILSRVFMGLFMTWEPDIQKLVKNIYLDKSPKDVFEKITEMVGDQSASEADLFYGYNVISSVDYERLDSAF